MIEIICLNCKNVFESKIKNRKFCSRTCAVTFNNKKRSPELKQRLLNGSIRFCKGKTLEEKCGLEKAIELKKKLSLRNSGKNNPNWNGIYRGTRIIKKGKTYEEIFGDKKADEIKKKLSDNNTGKNNPMYGKPSPKKSGNGWSGYYEGYYFRSLLELSYLKYLLDNKVKFESGEKKKYLIEYKLNGINRTYHPDFYLIDTNEIIELKPKKIINSFLNTLKFKAAKNTLGNKFKILTQDDIKVLDISEIQKLIKIKKIQFDKSKMKKIKRYIYEHSGRRN